MKYVFRLNTNLVDGESGLKNDLKDWEETIATGYSASEIAQIPASNLKSTNEPTSIPSPFARIALTKTAFAEVAAKGTNALMAYQQIVSNSLDVAEIFFNFDKLKSHSGLEIIKWQYSDLQKIQSTILKSTLELFFQSDAFSLNLTDQTTFYFLYHKKTGKIIGGTSPRTVFFSAANVIGRKGGEVEPEFIKSNGTFFSENKMLKEEEKFDKILLSKESGKTYYAFSDNNPLKNRDNEFQDYLHTWVKINNNVITNGAFPELQAYLSSQIPPKKGEHFVNLPNNLNEYSNLVFANIDVKIYPEVLGRNLMENTVYDFFEDHIIQLQKPIENDYFSGNHTRNDTTSVLLPLKDKFFDLFTVDQLKSMIKIRGTSSIEIKIEITKTVDEILTLQKTYTNNNIVKLSSETNFLLFPNVKFSKPESSFYRFGLFREFSESMKLSAKFFNKKESIVINEINEIITRNTKDSLNNVCTTYALESREIDRIKILIDNRIGGIIIPNLDTKSNNIDFKFAVDFGTTNTHIEYTTSNDGNIKPFDISDNDKQISWFVNPGDKVSQSRLVADIDFIPEHIGYNDTQIVKVKFPTRTVLIVANEAKTNIKLPFVHTNIAMPFDKRIVPAYNGNPITQLKWDADKDKVGFYIENLCYLIRNKVVLNNGNLDNTLITWTYPLSMNTSRLGEIETKWNIAYKKYFGDTANNCKNLTESLAPFYHYSDLPSHRDYIKDLVSIDIGGGTTDVVFVKDGKPNFVSSFRFAANDLFGLGDNITQIVAKHKDDIEKKINPIDNSIKTFNSIKQNTEFGDFASFFFSLQANEDLTSKGIIIDFNGLLRSDNEQKLVFLLFYVAIIYHTAQVMNAKELAMPRHLTFSGNGSRIIDIIGKNDLLEKIATLIFEKIFTKKYGTDGMPTKLEIISNTSNPKEVTCKGVIHTMPDTNGKTVIFPPIDNIVLLGTDINTFATNETYSELSKDNDLVGKINAQVVSFFSYVFDELLQCSIQKQTGTETLMKALAIPNSSIQKAKNIVENKSDMANITNNRIKTKDKTADIEETFFFFPIPTLLKTISREIDRKEDNQ